MPYKFNTRIIATSLLAFALTGCGGKVFVQPASVSAPITIRTSDTALAAAVKAASKTDWTVKTVSKETGYVYAERQIQFGFDRNLYKLEVNLPISGSGEVTAKVTPPTADISRNNPQEMAAQYMQVFKETMAEASPVPSKTALLHKKVKHKKHKKH